MAKRYGDAQNYESKLEKVMGRLGVESYEILRLRLGAEGVLDYIRVQRAAIPFFAQLR